MESKHAFETCGDFSSRLYHYDDVVVVVDDDDCNYYYDDIDDDSYYFASHSNSNNNDIYIYIHIIWTNLALVDHFLRLDMARHIIKSWQ